VEEKKKKNTNHSETALLRELAMGTKNYFVDVEH
jgi:hypothetical protein